MTPPREPDRYGKRVGELARHVEELIFDGDEECGSRLRWSLRRMAEEFEADALARAAQFVDDEDEGRTGRGFELGDVGDFRKRCVAGIRALASPAAAPAAEPDQVSRILGRGHVENPREGEPGDTETYSEPVAPAPDLRAMLAHGIADAEGYIQTERQQGDVQMESFHAGRRAAYQQLEAALDRLAARTSPGGAGEGKT